MEERSLADRVAAVSALDEPIRRALFEYVSRSESPVSRDEAAEALGLARSTAAFHLDRLAEEGLLAVEFRRLTGRTGPGSGRPAKLYRRGTGEIAVTIPERHYDFAGQLLLSAIEEAARTGEPVVEVLLRIAGETGRSTSSAAVMSAATSPSTRRRLSSRPPAARRTARRSRLIPRWPWRRSWDLAVTPRIPSPTIRVSVPSCR